MKRKIVFAILCIGILSIGTIVYASFAQRDSTSMLSDREMAQITGTAECTCHLIEHVDCRYWHDLECATGTSCDSEDSRFHDPFRYTTTSQGEKNNMKPSDGTVACYTPTNVVDSGWDNETTCDPNEPVLEATWDIYDYAGWWYRCRLEVEPRCKECSWGTPSGDSAIYEDDRCVPI